MLKPNTSVPPKEIPSSKSDIVVPVETDWITLANIQQATKDFVVVLDDKHNELFAVGDSIKSLLKYSFDKNAWIEYNIHPSQLNEWNDLICYEPIAMDSDSQKIYVSNKPGSIVILTLNKDNQAQFEIINDLPELQMRFAAKGIIIKNEFHIIGGHQSNKHIKYNPESKKVEVLHNMEPLRFHQIIKAKNKLLMFGGEDDQCQPIDTVNEYDIIGNKWSDLHCKIPKGLSGFGCTPILNGQFVALFGGITAGNLHQKHIYIYSIRDKTFQESKIKCPHGGDQQAFTINDRDKDQVITFGYVRGEWSECGMDHHLFPPQYLIRIICGYYWNEWIHLSKMSAGNIHHHCKIDVFKLLDLK